MRYRTQVRVGPATFRIGSSWRDPVAALDALYSGYARTDAVPDFTVRLEPIKPWRRLIRPSIAIEGDFTLPDAAPLPLSQGLLAAEMAMNLQMALGWRRQMLVHAAVVARDGAGLMLSGESGSGKSTLAAMLMLDGWRLLGDEFALVGPGDGALHPFPRPISLKNASIALAGDRAPAAQWGPLLAGTPKGDIRHLGPDAASLAAMDESVPPRLLVFPRYGLPLATRAIPRSEAFARLTQASTNYTRLGEPGFVALTRLVRDVPAVALDFPDWPSARDAVAALWHG